jgi:sorting nexin-9/18/33
LQQKQEKEVINMGDIITRLDVVNYATLAEVNYFNGQKINDFSLYMRSFLSKQIEFYSEITEKLQKALAKFEVLPANN